MNMTDRILALVNAVLGLRLRAVAVVVS